MNKRVLKNVLFIIFMIVVAVWGVIMFTTLDVLFQDLLYYTVDIKNIQLFSLLSSGFITMAVVFINVIMFAVIISPDFKKQIKEE